MLNIKKILAVLFRKPVSLYQLNTYNVNQPVKVIIGSGYTHYKGWIHTDIDTFNILKKDNWNKYFQPDRIDRLQLCFTYLKPGGALRIAIPDGFHPDPAYIEKVRPGGTGDGADDHKVLYNYKLLTQWLQEVGFEVNLLEYFDENGKFQKRPWSSEQGYIKRSADNDSRNAGGKLVYTSLIVDAVKPL
jgi:predicted SAM-dependent methyltransferase